MNRKNNFDFLRFLFASLVLISHAWPLTTRPPIGDPLQRLTPANLSLGTLSVDAFFLMSGYLVTGSWMRTRRVAAYLRKRILRIYPAFIVITFVDAFILAPGLSATAIHPFPVRRQFALLLR